MDTGLQGWPWPMDLAYNPPSPPDRPFAMPALHLATSFAASQPGACVRVQGMASPLRDLSTQLTFKVTGSPAVLSQAVRGYLRA